MTFSHAKVVEAIRKRFVPVWESAAPVSVATFDLGDGRSVRGTLGGEIAIYFCRPDGKVYDILPALQSPKLTLEAIERAAKLFEETKGDVEAVRRHHARALGEMVAKKIGEEPSGAQGVRKARRVKRDSGDGGTEALGEMALSKRGPMPGSSESEAITVIEPGGLHWYRRQVHEAMAMEPLKTPDEWKPFIFEHVLGQELKGGESVYHLDSLEPLSLIGD